jgi:RimJ/RimL family protein N-acetyltransferase
VFEGRVVGLRPPEPPDLPVFTRLANDPEVRQLVVGWDWQVSEFSQQAWLDRQSTNAATKRLSVVDLATGQPLGLAGFWEIDWHNRSAMSAIKLDAALAPRGAGSDAIMLVNALAFYEVGLRRLWGSILDFNAPSYGAYVRKCGWRLEGVEKESIFRGGEWRDLYRVAILRADFDEHPLAAEYVKRVRPVEMQSFEVDRSALWS